MGWGLDIFDSVVDIPKKAVKTVANLPGNAMNFGLGAQNQLFSNLTSAATNAVGSVGGAAGNVVANTLGNTAGNLMESLGLDGTTLMLIGGGVLVIFLLK